MWFKIKMLGLVIAVWPLGLQCSWKSSQPHMGGEHSFVMCTVPRSVSAGQTAQAKGALPGRLEVHRAASGAM